MRFAALRRHGLLPAALAAAALPGVAHADCDIPDSEDLSGSVNLTVGASFGPRSGLVIGLEGVICLAGPLAAYGRIEAIGNAAPRFELGLRGYPMAYDTEPDPYPDFPDNRSQPDRVFSYAELGFAHRSASADHRSAQGLTVGAGFGPVFAHAGVSGFIPLAGDPGQWDVQAHADLIVLYPAIAAFVLAVAGDGGGRPLTHDGGKLLPALTSGRQLDAPRAAWAHDARLEYSSVWSFLRLAAELAAAGAPRELVLRALEAADDEVRHAEACAALAGGLDLAPLPAHLALPRPGVTLAELAREAFVEGCLGEGAAAGRAAAAARMARDPAARVQAGIAVDERRHAELSWDVLGHAVGRDEGARAELEALLELPPPGQPESDLAAGAWGRLPARAAAQVDAAEHDAAVARARALLR